MASYYVMAERDKSMSTPSRDEELIPLPAGKWFTTLKDAFDWAEIGNLIGCFLGWEKHVFMLTPKKLVRITKVTEQMIYEDELHEALERLKAIYHNPVKNYTDTDSVNPCDRLKQKLNSIYGYTATANDSFPEKD